MNVFIIISESRPVLSKINFKSVIEVMTIKNMIDTLFVEEKS